MKRRKKQTKQEERLMQKYPDTDTFRWYNANPEGHITEDCITRALACGMDITWQEAHCGLYNTEMRTMFVGDKAVEKYLQMEGWVKHKQPRKEDGTKYTGAQFARWLSTNFPNGELGNVICTVANHMFCIKATYSGDGINCRYKVHDTWNSTDKCIGNYWVKQVQRKLLNKGE